jgi:flavin reductase (DIM6/NTAB) family NADH-FMN oxidoreductase RutF
VYEALGTGTFDFLRSASYLVFASLKTTTSHILTLQSFFSMQFRIAHSLITTTAMVQGFSAKQIFTRRGSHTLSCQVTPNEDETSTSSNSTESGDWKTYSPEELGTGGTYRLGVSAVVPRPVAVITSTNAEGAVNCAPFSYTGLLSHDPPMVAHGICMDNGNKKDTLVNIELNKNWVFNVLTNSYLEQANACSEAMPYGVSEVEKTGLSTLPSLTCQTPRLAQAMVSMECELESTKEVFNAEGKHTTTIVMGKIVRYHVHSSVLKDNGEKDYSPAVDLEKLQAVGRAGDITYWPAGDGQATKMKRP